MKICIKGKQKIDYPEVKPGDLIRVEDSSDDNPIYLVCGFKNSPVRLRLYSLDEGRVWSSTSLWGSTFKPSKFTKVTNEYCLTTI